MERIATYDVLGQLGRGGMGVVLHARCAATGREVALKLLDPALLSANGLRRFEREVEALTRLRHESVVKVLDAGRSAHGPWVAMERVEGESLQARLDRAGPLAPAEVVALGRAMCDALAHAHAMGVVHRDVKPGNVLLERGGRVVLVDFGLARLGGPGLRLTATGELLGTPGFMAPEQAQDDGQVGPLADVYAVGATLYAALTGRPPIEGSGLLQLLDRILTHAPAPPSAVRPTVPPALSALVMRCLEKAPDRRPASAEALREALEPVLADAARGVGERTPTPAPRRRRGLVAGLTLAAGVAALAAANHAGDRALRALATAEAEGARLDVGALIMRGQAQLRRGDGAGALVSAEEGLRLAPDDPRLHSLRAGGNLLLGRLAEARADLDRLERAAGRSASLLLDLAAVAERLGEHARSLAAAERGLAAGGDARRFEVLRTSALLRLDRHAEAAQAARAALLLVPDEPRLHWNLAAALMQLDRPAARRLIDECARRWPRSPDWQAAHANQLEEAGDLAGAVNVWDRYLSARPDDAQALCARARLRGLRGDAAAALEDVGRAAELAPRSRDVLSLLVEAQRLARAWPDAERTLERLLALHPDDATLLRRRAEVRHQLGRTDEALADLDRAVELDPDLAEAWSDRGGMRASWRDDEGALADLARAVALAPDDAHALFNLAELHLLRGSWAEALTWAERGRQATRGRDPHPHAQLAVALHRLGRPADADAALERALALVRDPLARERLRDKVVKLRGE